MSKLYSLLHKVNCVIPKSNIILFSSFPPYADNAAALYEYIIANRPDIVSVYRLYWGQDEEGKRIDFGKNNSQFVKKKSLKGYLTFLRAKYVISTHGYFTGLKSGNGQTQVNLWHGCGYKDTPDNECLYRGDVNIVTGTPFVDNAAKIFATNKESINITGYPRNDYLFHKAESLKALEINKKQYKKVLIWLPTYRKSNVGSIHSDGLDSSFGIGSIGEEGFARLNKVLAENNFLLIIKPHPMDCVTMQGKGPWANIKVFSSNDLADKGVDLYELLGETDTLLSDYSSVVIDYSLLDKPITMVLSDMNEYKDSRGFLFENVEDWFPGPIVHDMDSLVDYLNNYDKVNAQWEDKRRKLAEKFNKYHDDKSCERVCNLIFGEK